MRANEKFVFTPEEAAQYAGIGEGKIRRLCSSGEIKAMRSGNRWLIPKKLLEEFVIEKAMKGESV